MPVTGADREAHPKERAVQAQQSSQREAWTLIGWIGIAFVLMGAADILLGIYPTAFGTAEWEFGVITGTLNGLAIPTMGAYLLLASGVARNSRKVVRAISVAMLCVVLLLVLMGLVYVLVIPVAIRSVDRSELVLLGMKKAIAKATMLFVAYAILYVIGGLRGWKLAKRLGAARSPQ